MNRELLEARQAIRLARQALQNGDRRTARRWAELAASLAPQLEDPWLILAAVANPRASLAYAQQALKISPNSRRARQAIAWASKRLGRFLPELAQAAAEPRVSQPAAAPTGEAASPVSSRASLFPVLLLAVIGGVLAWAAWSAVSSPALAFIRSGVNVVTSLPPQYGAQADVAKPTYTPTPTNTPTPTPTFTPTPTATNTPTITPTFRPTKTPKPTATYIPQSAETNTPPPNMPITKGERWIDVNLTQQRVYAYQGKTVVNSFLASTGTWQYPTVTGQYYIYIKLRYADMAGPGYYLPDVPYTMYFYRGYGLHGTYWHHNFGTPMSHGCVNLSIPDAEWLYNWASVGTLVNVHY
jgi:lipoprotein-anchoring transpeptidase ErfK/SrfK